MTSDANGVYRGVYTYGQERISVRDLVEVEGVPNDPLYYMYDGRGSVTQLTNAVGNVRDKYRYTPFGDPMEGGQLSPNTKLLNNPYGYNGEYHDLESGFQYLRARYYNPETARFITRDSYLGEINEPLTLNRYAYTANNPVKYKDPSGNDFEDGATGTRARSVNISTKSASGRPVVGWGSRGDAVVMVQNILDEQGYYLGLSGVDGIYGKYTHEAIEAYQTAHGLQSDGIVGPETWGSFNSYINKKAAESRGRSNNSNACDNLGGGVASGNGAQGTAEAKYTYNMIENPGPLAKLNPGAAATFESGKYNLIKLKEDTILYRGGQAGGGKNAFGQFFTRTAPESSAIVRIDSAVKPQWIDPKTGALTASSPIESVYAIKIPKGTTIYEGPAGYQSGIYIGGKEQIFISKPWEIPGVKIISETKLPK